MISRRGFLTGLLTAAGAAVVAPTLLEELIEPTKTYFLPPRRIVRDVGPYTIEYDAIGWPNQDIEALVKRMLARDLAKHMDELAYKTFNPGWEGQQVVLVNEGRTPLRIRQGATLYEAQAVPVGGLAQFRFSVADHMWILSV